MKYSQRFLPLKVYLATSMFLGQPGICQFTSPNFRNRNYPQSISLIPPRWEYYSQFSPWKIFENFSFSPVRQAVPTGVLRQGVSLATSTSDPEKPGPSKTCAQENLDPENHRITIGLKNMSDFYILQRPCAMWFVLYIYSSFDTDI